MDLVFWPGLRKRTVNSLIKDMFVFLWVANILFWFWADCVNLSMQFVFAIDSLSVVISSCDRLFSLPVSSFGYSQFSMHYKVMVETNSWTPDLGSVAMFKNLTWLFNNYVSWIFTLFLSDLSWYLLWYWLGLDKSWVQG